MKLSNAQVDYLKKKRKEIEDSLNDIPSNLKTFTIAKVSAIDMILEVNRIQPLDTEESSIKPSKSLRDSSSRDGWSPK